MSGTNKIPSVKNWTLVASVPSVRDGSDEQSWSMPAVGEDRSLGRTEYIGGPGGSMT